MGNTLELKKMSSLTINEKRKLNFGRLLVIAGPSCSGKSHLIAKLQAGEHDFFFSEVNFDKNKPLVYLSLNKLDKLDEEYYPVVILHLDLLRLNKFYSCISEMLTNGRDDVVAVTLCARRKVIIYRLCKRTLREVYDNVVNGGGRKSILHKFMFRWRCYNNDKALHQRYNEWFQMLEDRNIVENYLLDVNRDETQSPQAYSKSLFQLLTGFVG